MLALHVKIPGAASAISFEAVRQKVFAKRWGAGERDRSRNALQKVVFSIADPVAVRDHDGLLRNFTTCCEDRCQRYDAALARAGVRTQISEAWRNWIEAERQSRCCTCAAIGADAGVQSYLGISLILVQ
jgi:hypothetical protein